MVFSTTYTWAGGASAVTPATPARIAANPIYPQIYQVKKIVNEPIPIASFATSDPSTYTYSSRATTPTFVRDQIVFDKVVNAEFSLDADLANLDTSGTLYKFYPPTNAYRFAGQCSLRGICDTTSGQCQCFGGFDGDNCQRIDALAA